MNLQKIEYLYIVSHQYNSTEQSRLEIALLFQEAKPKNEIIHFQKEDVITTEMTIDSKIIVLQEDDELLNLDFI